MISDTGKVDTFTERELKELWRRHRRMDDRSARERLILVYAPIVSHVSRRIAGGLPGHVETSDLVSFGMLGLMEAVDRFDPERDVKFETFATLRIRGAIMDELRALDWAPRSIRSRAREVERAHTKLERRFQRDATDTEVADEMKISVEELASIMTRIAGASLVALDETRTANDGSEDSIALRDSIKDPSGVDPAQEMDATEATDMLTAAVDGLPDREKLVVALHYYESLTLKEIGELLGVTESRVSQLHAKAVGRLKMRLGPLVEPFGT